MTESTAKFYASELLLGLEELHSFHIVYRDLKPDNVLLDDEGHVCLSDFGLAVLLTADTSAQHLRNRSSNEEDWHVAAETVSEEGKLLQRRPFTTVGSAGTNGYKAPEVEENEYYGVEVDLWSFGITLFELIEKARPFPISGRRAHSDYSLQFYHCKDPQARDLLKRLLNPNKAQRLGCGESGIAEVKAHPFFQDVDWAKVAAKQVAPPFKPRTDRANCSHMHELYDQFLNDDDELEKKMPPITPEQEKQFAGYEFNTQPPDLASLPSNLVTKEAKKRLAARRQANAPAAAAAVGPAVELQLRSVGVGAASVAQL